VAVAPKFAAEHVEAKDLAVSFFGKLVLIEPRATPEA